jgi:peptidoglycan/LPS O-acetylase OafA/YrhL
VARRIGHVPALDGMRGVAVLAVVAFHFFNLPGGLYGVDLFFVLSGFLITTLLLEERRATGTVSLRAFYRRRAQRLLPAVSALLTLTLLLATDAFLLGDRAMGRLLVEGAAVCLFYGANIWRMLGHSLPVQLAPLWSLAQEEQFYVVWPPLFVLLFRGRALRLGVVLLAAALAVIGWRFALVLRGGASARIYFGPDTRADGLLLGSSVAAFRFAGIRLRPTARALQGRFVVSAGLVGFVALISTVRGQSAFGEGLGFAVADGLAVVLLLGSLASGGQVLSWSPIAWIGRISYGIYVWQASTVLFFGHPLARALAAVMGGYGSTRWIERPFRRGFRERVERRLPALASRAVGLVPLRSVAGGGGGVGRSASRRRAA